MQAIGDIILYFFPIILIIQGAISTHTGKNRATAILYPEAVYKGQTLPTQVGIEQQPFYTQ
jgi:hypothetical protein